MSVGFTNIYPSIHLSAKYCQNNCITISLFCPNNYPLFSKHAYCILNDGLHFRFGNFHSKEFTVFSSSRVFYLCISVIFNTSLILLWKYTSWFLGFILLWRVAKYGVPYSDYLLCISPIQVHTLQDPGSNCEHWSFTPHLQSLLVPRLKPMTSLLQVRLSNH